jgi:endonuclease/exonuclease/phosphatase family metal-dependent hydrolase
MKIVSWNVGGCHRFVGDIQKGGTYEEENIPYFCKQLETRNADFLALQEVLTYKDPKVPTQSQVISHTLGFKNQVSHPYTFHSAIMDTDAYISLGNISFANVKNTYFYLTPNPNLKIVRANGDEWSTLDAGFLISEFTYKGTDIIVANCHLLALHYFKRSWVETEFQNVKDDITKLLLSFLKKPTIVLGDFNYANLREIYPKIFKDGGYSEAFENVETAPGKGQQDHILYSPHWKLNSYNLSRLEADHYLCEANLELK